MSAIRWAVMRDRFPFSAGEVIGFVHAPDRPSALHQAKQLFGGAIVVQSVASRAAMALEKPMPTPDPTRDQYGLKKRPNRGHYQPRGRHVKKPSTPPEHNA